MTIKDRVKKYLVNAQIRHDNFWSVRGGENAEGYRPFFVNRAAIALETSLSSPQVKKALDELGIPNCGVTEKET
jgi:hypothetical protein